MPKLTHGLTTAEYTELCAALGELNVLVDQQKVKLKEAEADRDRYRAALEHVREKLQSGLAAANERHLRIKAETAVAQVDLFLSPAGSGEGEGGGS